MSTDTIDRFRRLPLNAHRFLDGVPLHSLDFVELPGGPSGMSMPQLREAIGFDKIGEQELGFVPKALFGLRGLIGKMFGWDDVPQLVESNSYLSQLSDADRAKSLIPPGKTEGINRIIYCFENEQMMEIINRTVHCFWVLASQPLPGGYGLYVAVYVKRLNWRTPIYMAVITPMLKWIIYPAMLNGVKRAWLNRFPTGKTSLPLQKVG